jgi:Cu/Ag efflux protein CusF
MIKRFVFLALAVLFLASVASLAISAEGKEMKLSGTISVIDAAAKSVTIKDDKGKETMITGVDEKTLGGLKAGDAVESVYAVKGGKNVCKSITKKGEPKKPSAAGY